MSAKRSESTPSGSSSSRLIRIDPNPAVIGAYGSSIARRTEQMGLRLERITSGESSNNSSLSTAGETGNKDSGRGRNNKPRFSKSSLLILFQSSPNHRQYSHGWGKDFVPYLLSWAGAQDDPFGTNGQMDTALLAIWEPVYPEVKISGKGLEILQGIVRPLSRDSAGRY
ncbi:hypothetical protein BC827DRAFT_871237 [Russula dissimulans]|nr:hypothetical protein BC827DRAFT_871237 [Russula dissimulans]